MTETEHEIPIESPNFDKARESALKTLHTVEAQDKINELILDRLTTLEALTEIPNDSRAIEKALVKILNRLNELDGGFTQTNIEQARIAAILHDIGKSGPANALPDQSRSVALLFSLDNVEPDKTVEDAVSQTDESKYKGFNKEGLLAHLEELGLSKITMQEFWDKHAYWTKEVLEAQETGLDSQIIVIAASHHIDKGINPCNIPIEESSAASVVIGLSEEYKEILEERTLLVVDKYQASRARGRLTHEQAMEKVRHILGPRAQDRSVAKILEILDELGKNENLFT
jgi:hypothetical protein